MDNNRFHKLTALLRDYYLDALLFLLPTIFGLGQFIITDEVLKLVSGLDEISKDSISQFFWRKIGIWAMIISFPSWIIVGFLHIKRQKRISKMETENLDLKNDIDSLAQDFQATTEGYIKGIARELKFGSKSEKTERITIYGHDRTTNLFIPFGRFSSNPKYESKGRDYYPDNQGCIGKTWENQCSFANDFPQWESNNGRDYIERAKNDGLRAPEIKKLKMKSRLYFGWRIADTKGDKPLAVLIIESTDPNRWTKDELESYFQGESRKLSEVLERLAPRIPNISSAKKEGF